VASLQAVLKCLEVSLRSDAHEGGSWIRDGESERFELLLGPLGKLFHCQVDSGISYQDLMHGQSQKEDSGSVAECIVALASAAGDEQKWKPLNHAVLQACSHESRGEVRKAGVRCLLSLIKSIGEEYMVLIPECLPVLSELLEDTDEEISGAAQECITSSEELLGESLEDSLL
jgi:U3 small nucleolar RNA-associated protein 10